MYYRETSINMYFVDHFILLGYFSIIHYCDFVFVCGGL